jgi:putative endonuclease
MSFYVYMLKSKSIRPITYIGYTNDLKKRIVLHNSGKGAKFTRGRKWVLIYKEKFKSKSEAISREYYIKYNRTLRNKIKNEYINSVTL